MSIRLSWFAAEAELSTLEGAMRHTSAAHLDEVRMALAWQLRQRDPARAQGLLQQLQAQPQSDRDRARLRLLHASLSLVRGDLACAGTQIEQALLEFGALGDGVGCADAYALLADLGAERGDPQQQIDALRSMQRAAAGDSERSVAAVAAAARVQAFSAYQSAQAWFSALPEQEIELAPASARSHVKYYHATVLAMRGDFGRALPHYIDAFKLARDSGQIQTSLLLSCNIAFSFSHIQNHEGALEWALLAREEAERLGSQSGRAIAMTAAGEAMRKLGRLPDARALLDQAWQFFATQPQARGRGVLLLRMAELCLDEGRLDEVLKCYADLEAHALCTRNSDLFQHAEVGLARVALAQGRLGQAHRAAQALLDRADVAATRRIEALELLAELYERYPDYAVSSAESALALRLQLLGQAQTLAAGLADYRVPASLLDALGRAHAESGAFSSALACVRQANAVRAALDQQSTQHRAMALRVQHETQSVRAEAEQQRQHAAEQQRRSALLQQSNDDLEMLGSIGRDIIGRHDANDVAECLHRHTLQLMPVDAFVLFRARVQERSLVSMFAWEDGDPLGVIRLDLDDPESQVARCARERRQLRGVARAPIPGTLGMQSSLFAPLVVEGQLYGVLTLQAIRPEAFGERESAMIDSLAAFAAIGLSNAEGLERLRRTQALAAQRNKLASLGELVLSLGQEIQAPMETISAGGTDIATLLDRLLLLLPELLRRLDADARNLLGLLLSQQTPAVLSSQACDERMWRRQVAQSLQRSGFAEARILADTLPLGAEPESDALRRLLAHTQRDELLQLLRQLGQLLRSTADVNAAASRAARVVHALKVFARMEQSQGSEPLDLRDSLETVLTLYQHRFKQGVELCCRFDAVPTLTAGAGDLHQLWMLLLNAATQGLRSPGRLEWSLTQEGSDARIAVTSSAAGSELGATPAMQKIIAGHGGTITVERTITQGRKFIIRLPYNRERT